MPKISRCTFILLFLFLVFGNRIKSYSVNAEYEGEQGIEFPLDFPIAFSYPTELDRHPTATPLLSLRSLSFWERLFNLK